MINSIEKHWSMPSSSYQWNEDVFTYSGSLNKEGLHSRIIVFNSILDWNANKEKITKHTFKGIILIIGGLAELSSIYSEIETNRIQRIIAFRNDTNNHTTHKLMLVLNYSNDKIPYREVRERYTFCPICNQSSKDYGGKKHHYPSDGTWIRDVWNKFKFEEDLINDKLFLEAIFNLYCNSSTEKIFIVFGSQNYDSNKSKIDSEKIKPVKGIPPLEEYSRYGQNILQGDCMELMPWLASSEKKYDLIFVDPPYNLGKEYDKYKDDKKLEHYTEWCVKWAKLAYLVLDDDGIFVILNTPQNILLQLPFLLSDYELIDDVVWDDLARPVARKMQPTYYSIIFLKKKDTGPIKSDWYKIREPTYCKRNGCLSHPDSFSPGISIWSDIHRTRQKSRRWGHPCNLPEELVERIIQITKNAMKKDQLRILDFFLGVGTTTMASLMANCESTGIELSYDYFNTAIYRLENKYYRNPNCSSNNFQKKKSKKALQKLVAFSLEKANRTNQGYSTEEQVDWLISNNIIKTADIEGFVRPGEILKSVGKEGAPGEEKINQKILEEYISV
jgi:site-specific DNA-methyltransferase (adenine-specific)